MKRCAIICGAEIRNYAAVRPFLREDDFCIYCDSGLYHEQQLGRKPDLIIGDFDSHPNPNAPEETIVLPHEKDDTDSFYAAREAIRRGYTEALLLGVIGGRFDHSIANLSVLVFLEEHGCHALIVDDYSEMELIVSHAEIPDCYPYFSLCALTGTACGVTITDAKFTLDHADIPWNYQYGVSNEVLPGKIAKVDVEKGPLLLIRDRI